MDENLNLEGNKEIEKALKEFEVKSSVEQIQKQKVSENLKDAESPKMIKWTMKIFGLKEQKHAEYILVAFALIVLGISVFIFFDGNKSVDDPDIQVLAMPME
jgi:hypothetical protein